MKKIKSVSNKNIKELELLTKSTNRKETSSFLIDGQREIEEAILSNIEISEIFICHDLIKKNSKIIDVLDDKIKNIVSIPVFKKLSYKNKPDGYLAKAKKSTKKLDLVSTEDNELILVLENVEKPGNLGAIIRTACAAGVKNIILSENQTDLYNPNTIRASEGLIFKLNIIESNNNTTFKWLKNNKFKIYGAATKKSKLYTDINYNNKVALVFGSESKGLSNFWLEKCEKLIKIPMNAMIDSLNVSVSLAIIIYEALRQRDLFDN